MSVSAPSDDPRNAPSAAQSQWIWSRMTSDDESILRQDRETSIRGTSNDPCLLAVKEATGIWLTDHAGRRYMDFYGNNCHHIGHRHPRLIAALRQQMESLTFVARGLTNGPSIEFADQLIAAAQWPGAKVVSARSGADAIEIALSLARANTGRYKTISFYDSYHGRSAGALSVSGRPPDKLGLGPLLPGAIHIPPFYRSGDGALGDDSEAYARQSIAMMRTVLEQERDVAAVLAETIRNGAYVPPDWYWPQVRSLCDHHGALLILDEIATGLGKTGSLFNYHRYGVRPDIVAIGKAIGGAVVPLAAVIADGALDSAPSLNIGYFTHEKNPLCARAGVTTLAILEDENLAANAQALGRYAREGLDALKLRNPCIREIRSAGLMLTIEFQQAISAGLPGDVFARAVQRRCIERGVLPTPPRGASLTFSAPLTLQKREWDDALAIMTEAIANSSAPLM